MLEAVLLLAGPALQPPGVSALGEGFEHVLEVIERLQTRHALASRPELARGLWTAAQQDGERGELVAAEPEGFLGQMPVLDRAAAGAAREPRPPVAARPARGL